MKLVRHYANNATTFLGDTWGVTIYRGWRTSRLGLEFSPKRWGARWLHIWWGSPTHHRRWARSIYINLGGR